VFTGIGEFTIHKEFVSAKIPGEVASLQDPALDRILEFAAEVGLVVLIHNDFDIPFPKEGSEPAYLSQLKALFKRHPNTTIIWAHIGLGRVVRPSTNHASNIEGILSDPDLRHVYFDISWDEEIVGPTEHTSYPRNASSHSKGARDGTKAAEREALTLTWVSSYSIL
jgi:predicted TIM-barrel fold metal-dependent hydrolase